MSNSIDKNNIEVNNTISDLFFSWSAQFKDGNIINQFDEGKDINFKKVKENLDKLAYFYLTNNKGKIFTVDLLKGLIYFNSPQIIDNRISKNRNNIRLIYKRIRRQFIGTEDLKIKEEIINYLLGLQYTDDIGNNHKILLQIDNEGNVSIGD